MPRELEQRAAAGEVTAGLLPLAGFFRLESRFERLGHFGIAVHGRANSTLLFSKRPIRQLDGATIAVTPETSTTICLLRLILEQRYELRPASYAVGAAGDADALLLIGDEALRFRQANTRYPFEVDVAFEWWLWQHLPFVFAVWAVRKDVDPKDRKRLEAALARALAVNLGRLEAISQSAAETVRMSAADVQAYLEAFVYRLGPFEEAGIARFKELANASGLL